MASHPCECRTTAASTHPPPQCTGPVARLILQQCLSGRLQVKPAADGNDPEFVQIERGVVAYVCFLKGASSEILEKLVKVVLNTKLSEAASGKLVSVLDLPGNVLIIPQATLGGRLKGKVMQYHNNIDKVTGLQLYTDFVTMTKEAMEGNSRVLEASCVVRWGTYGNRQVLNLETNGPYTHLVEF